MQTIAPMTAPRRVNQMPPEKTSELDVLRSFLAQRDVPCPVCRYNLRGAGSDRCPECGARLDLRVGSIDLKLGPWLLAVFAVALPMGFSAVVATIAAIGAKISVYWQPRDWIILGTHAGLTAVCAVALRVLVKKRAAFLRRSRGFQWLLAWVLVAVMAVVQTAAVIAMNRYR